MQPLNRQETEDLILDLYYNQKKQFREIQKIVRKSPRDIRAVLNKVEPEQSSLSTSSLAYQMFTEGKTPIQVAITLNLREKEANDYYREYWNLSGLYDLGEIYRLIKDDLWSVIELYRQVKAENMNEKHVIRLLKIANNDIPSVEYRCQELEKEEASLNARNKYAAGIYQQFINLISRLNKRKEECVSACVEQKLEVARLQLRKMRLQAITDWFENNNEKCLIIRKSVKQEVENALEDRRSFLRASLMSLIQSLLKDPNRFYAYYFNTPLRATSIEGRCVQDDKIRQDYEDLVIDEAERLYSKTVVSITNEVFNSFDDKKSSVSSSLQSELSEQNGNDVQVSIASMHIKKENVIFYPEDKAMERTPIKELPDPQAS